jgi:hypothetical protein
VGLRFEQPKGKPYPLAHIEIEEAEDDDRNLTWILKGAREVSGFKTERRSIVRYPRLTMAFIGRSLGGKYEGTPTKPAGYSIFTYLDQLENGLRQAYGERSLPRELRGIDIEWEEQGVTSDTPLWRFFLIMTQGGIENPENITDVWIENTEDRRG